MIINIGMPLELTDTFLVKCDKATYSVKILEANKRAAFDFSLVIKRKLLGMNNSHVVINNKYNYEELKQFQKLLNQFFKSL